MQDPGNRILGPESRSLDQASWIQYPGTMQYRILTIETFFSTLSAQGNASAYTDATANVERTYLTNTCHLAIIAVTSKHPSMQILQAPSLQTFSSRPCEDCTPCIEGKQLGRIATPAATGIHELVEIQ